MKVKKKSGTITLRKKFAINETKKYDLLISRIQDQVLKMYECMTLVGNRPTPYKS